MNKVLTHINNTIYEKCSLQISEFLNEPESREYEACRFTLNGFHIVCRDAKITPKKIGQFVTFWKRNKNGITEPLNEKDSIDYYVINVIKESKLGQFILPKSILIEKGIVSTNKKVGKRGFRVYPSWDITNNKQAKQTQKWQLNYFIEIDSNTNLKHVKNLYGIE